MPTNLVDLVKKAGVVGAGGAGFPTHVKIDARAEIVIANGAECEPLLHTDQHIMASQAKELISGLKAVVEATGAKQGYIALKRKHTALVDLLSKEVSQENLIELYLMDNFYPAGDEHVLVNQVTNRLVPEGGIPLQIGVIVCNVSTLVNIHRAKQGIPVTERVLTITGEVAKSIVASLPVGTSIRQALELAGGPSVSEFQVINGGPMMGNVIQDLDEPITKTTSGLIVLPADHKLIYAKTGSMKTAMLKARSICCQCNYCTSMCPRYLLGHSIYPHKVIRSVSSLPASEQYDFTTVYSCSECGLCGLYNCVHGILPNRVNGEFKKKLIAEGVANPHKRSDIQVREGHEFRKVPTDRLIHRLDIHRYLQHEMPFTDGFQPDKVRLMLHQHIGAPSIPVVEVGQKVVAGEEVARIPEGSLGAMIHASISGKVIDVNPSQIVIVQEGAQ